MASVTIRLRTRRRSTSNFASQPSTASRRRPWPGSSAARKHDDLPEWPRTALDGADTVACRVWVFNAHTGRAGLRGGRRDDRTWYRVAMAAPEATHGGGGVDQGRQ